MRVQIARPHPDYPFAWVHVDITTDIDRPDLSDVLAAHKIRLVGRWEPHIVDRKIDSLKAPALLGDQFTDK